MVVIPPGAFCCYSFLRATREQLRVCWSFLGLFRQFLIPCYLRSYCEAQSHSLPLEKITTKSQSKTFENRVNSVLFGLVSWKQVESICSFCPALSLLLPHPQKVDEWKICKAFIINQRKQIRSSPKAREFHFSLEPVQSKGSWTAPPSPAPSYCLWKWRNPNWGMVWE